MKTKSLLVIVVFSLINGLIIPLKAIDYKLFEFTYPVCTSDSVPNNTQSLVPDSVITKPVADTLTADSTAKPRGKKKSFISSKVESSADDSILYSADGQKIFLFGNAKIKYEDIELSAAYIEVDMDLGIMYAEGTTDSVGKPKGQPVFKQGEEEMKANNLTYNINNEKGYIEGLYTEQQDGYLHSERTKKNPDNSINMIKGKYTTCDLDHPHFYIALSKGKVIPNKVIIAGPSQMVIEDIPLPIFIPFGFFPSTQKRASGFIIPRFGEEKNRGFYLTEGGYYFAMNDYMDLTVKGSIYSKGSWSSGIRSGYKVRYKFSGNFDLAYSKNVVGEPGLESYNESNSYSVRWSHSQDPKARPNSNFSASVNFASANNNKYNSTSSQDYLSNTISSSIAFRKTFANTPFSASINLNHTQNNRDSSISVTLPQATITMSRIQPFKNKKSVGKAKWYEDIGFAYSANFQNKLSTHIDSLFNSKRQDKFKNGIQHQPTISKSFKLFKYLSFSPGVSYGERWYFNRSYFVQNIQPVYTVDTSDITTGNWNLSELKNGQVYRLDTVWGQDTTYSLREETGFYRVYNYSYSAGVNTTIYGMVNYTKGPIKAIRHVMTPSVSYTWTPDFSQSKYGFYEVDPRDPDGKDLYSPYRDGIYGIPGKGKSGSVSFSLANNLEMKVKNANDTTTGEKKIALLESLNFNTSYNMLADSLNWSPLSISGRTTLFKSLSINFNASGDFYDIDEKGKKINHYYNQTNGNLVRFTNAGMSTGFSIDSKTFSGDSKDDDANDVEESSEPGKPQSSDNNDLADYDYFKIPWSLRFDYSLDYSKPAKVGTIRQTLNFSGDFSLTPKWKIGFQSGYDFDAREFSYTSFNLSRDLHCWAATLRLIPFGPRQSYNFSIAVKSSILQDLKYDKHRSWMDN